MHTTESERAKYARMWGHPDYRRHSPGLALAPEVFSHLDMQPGETLIDYGCGEGLALDWFRARGVAVTGVDLVSLREDIIEASLWELPETLGPADYAFSADVLEHLPEGRLDEVLGGIRARSRKAGTFSVATVPCKVGRRHGEELHLTVKPHEWWQDTLARHWLDVEAHATDREWRWLFVVR